MGAQQSKDELLYQQVSYGNVDGVKALRREAAGLEWIDKEGKTPLMLACGRPDLLNVAKVLIELGANVNAYRPGYHGGTPLHYASIRGLHQTVNLLLSTGANPLVVNDDRQTPLDLARMKGHCDVVRAIESRICLFCGWLREIYGPSILEAFASQWMQRKVWAVVLPCDSRNPTAPQKFELAIYPDLQAAEPRVTIALWKVHIEEPNFEQSDPALVIIDKASKIYDLLPYGVRTQAKSSYRRLSNKHRQLRHLVHSSPSEEASTQVIMDESDVPKDVKGGKKGKRLPNFELRYKFLSANEGEKQQLRCFYTACQGISQQSSLLPVAPPDASLPAPNPPHGNTKSPTTSASSLAPVPDEDAELAMAINASIQSALAEGVPVTNLTSSANRGSPSEMTTSYGWRQSSGGSKPEHTATHHNNSQLETPSVLPSAPSVIEEALDDGSIQYPVIDASPINLTAQAGSKEGSSSNNNGDASSSSSCVICLDASVEGACIPCGHMAGCMSCLNEIKQKNWGCPVCRATIEKVIKIYAV